MNGGNRDRGQADGFGLEILPKLNDVKSNDNSTSLLEFVVRSYIKECYQEVSSMETVAFPLVEPADIEKCSIVQFGEIEANILTLNTIINETKTLKSIVLRKCEEDENCDYDKCVKMFKEKIDDFLGRACKQVKEQEENLKDCKKKYSIFVFIKFF